MIILRDGELAGADNMRRDEALLEECAGDGVVRLRLYGWARPTLSLGYAQGPERFRERCAENHVDLVQRPTGGRAVLHQHELTYAFLIPMQSMPGDVRSTYRVIAGALLGALTALGVPAEMAEAPGAQSDDPNCFAEPSWYEIESGGRKLVGSAQVRRHGVILQHGALPLELDYDLWARLFAPGAPADYAATMRRRAVGLTEAAGRWIGKDELAEALAQAFREHFANLSAKG